MAGPRKHTLSRPPRDDTPPPAPESAPTIAVIDLGASAVRVVIAETVPNAPTRILEEASRGVLLGKDTFSHGRLSAASMEATLKVLEGFRRMMDTYGVVRYRAVATSAVREAANSDAFVDRVRLRTGIDLEVIDGSEENRLTYLAVREALQGHPALETSDALLVEIGGGSADISFLRKGQPVQSGTYALGSIRMRQSLSSFHGSHDQRMRLLRRNIRNVVDDLRREMPLPDATHFIALGSDVRFAASRLLGDDAPTAGTMVVSRDALLGFCDQIVTDDVDRLVERDHLAQAEAETLVPALLAYRELLVETTASEVVVPWASLRAGLLLDLVRGDDAGGVEELRRQAMASAAALGEKYRFDAPHGRNVAALALRLFDETRPEHGLTSHHRLLLEVASLLHDVGIYVNLKGHHKHTQYLLAASEIFGLSQEDMVIVGNVARYHRRATPQKSHLPYMALDRSSRVEVSKMAAILRLANAFDADHLQKVKDLKVLSEDGAWVVEVEGAGDLTIERLAALARSDFMTEVFGRRISFREAGGRA